MDFISEYTEILIISLLVIMVLLVIAMIVMLVKFARHRRAYLKMMSGTQVSNFEQAMIDVREELKELRAKQQNHNKVIDLIQTSMKTMKANLGIIRYNAFAQQGNDMSFSFAIVDEFQTGVVITGLHSREESYIYAKPLEQGNSKYALSPEELKAINLAVNKA